MVYLHILTLFLVTPTIWKIRVGNFPWRLQPQGFAWWCFNFFNLLWGGNFSGNLPSSSVVSATLWRSGSFCPHYHRCWWRWAVARLYFRHRLIVRIAIRPWSYHLEHRHIRRCWFRFHSHFQPDLLTAVQYSIKRGGVIELRYYSSSANGNICF